MHYFTGGRCQHFCPKSAVVNHFALSGRSLISLTSEMRGIHLSYMLFLPSYCMSVGYD